METMIYVTSDTFFGRSSKAKERGFKDAQEMQIEMIKRWNNQVRREDIVYHLGSFAWDLISTETAFMHLNGTINLIGSPYDNATIETLNIFKGVHKIHKDIHVIESLDCVLSYWPLRTWPCKQQGSLHIHGGDKRFKANLEKESRFNANCDLWSLAPISLDSLLEITKEYKNN